MLPERTERKNIDDILFLFVIKSANKKTGNIPQTYTSKNSCPVSCPFHGNGCYAESYHTNRAWNRCHVSIDELRKAVQASTAKGQLIRHNVAGDMAIPETEILDGNLVSALCDVYQDRKAYTYTHCRIDLDSAETIRKAQEKGFFINASCESIAQIKNARKFGVNTVLAVETMPEKSKVIDGELIVKCPAQYSKTKNCKNCGLCAKDRNYTIAFEAHGNGKKKAVSAIQKINLIGINL